MTVTATLPPDWRKNPAAAAKALAAMRLAQQQSMPPLVFDAPADLARVLDPTTVQTPALQLIDDALVWAYTTPGSRLIVTMPPQEGKSTRVSRVASLWALLRNPELRIGVASYAAALATGIGRDVRNWVAMYNGADGSADLRHSIAPDNGSAARWQLAGHRGGMLCVGVGGGFTGNPVDALVIDDPFSGPDQSDSEAYRNQVWKWFGDVARTRLGPGASIVVVMTRWHEDDLAGRLIAQQPDRWRVINIPAQADHDPERGEVDPLGRQPGEFMISARGRSLDEWQETKAVSSTRTWSALYQGHPTPDTGNVFARSWWRRYAVPPWTVLPDGSHRTIDMDEVLISVDAAFKDTSTSDFVVMQVWARRGPNAYLLDQVRDRLSFTNTVTRLKTLISKWPDAAVKLIEDKANGSAIIDTLKQSIPGFIPVEPTGSKIARAYAVTPFVESGNVLLPDPALADWVNEYINELALFPNDAHDDQVDATSQALARMFVDGTGATAWTDWVKTQAKAEREREAAEAAAVKPREDLDPVTAARQAAFAARSGAPGGW